MRCPKNAVHDGLCAKCAYCAACGVAWSTSGICSSHFLPTRLTPAGLPSADELRARAAANAECGGYGSGAYIPLGQLKSRLEERRAARALGDSAGVQRVDMARIDAEAAHARALNARVNGPVSETELAIAGMGAGAVEPEPLNRFMAYCREHAAPSDDGIAFLSDLLDAYGWEGDRRGMARAFGAEFGVNLGNPMRNKRTGKTERPFVGLELRAPEPPSGVLCPKSPNNAHSFRDVGGALRCSFCDIAGNVGLPNA